MKPSSTCSWGDGGGRGGLGDRVEELGADVGEHFAVEVPLRAEVLVQDGLGDPGRFGHVVHGGGVEALLAEDPQGHLEQLLAPASGRQAGGVGADGHGVERTWIRQQETDHQTRNTSVVRPPKQTPAMTARRPAEPFRPIPARKLGVSLLSVKARRRRFSADLPPRGRERGLVAPPGTRGGPAAGGRASSQRPRDVSAVWEMSDGRPRPTASRRTRRSRRRRRSRGRRAPRA